ncbi:MAG: sigma-70 family RNA polymerase sigma factor, partial [Lactobacillus iners]|nr:sigma-70 family RNA polymerase sigma factor [Lactobacillus iners]
IIPQHDNFLLLQDEIKSMSPTERLIFSQHWINNKTITEISQQYNLSRSTLQRNKAALRLRLREKLQE